MFFKSNMRPAMAGAGAANAESKNNSSLAFSVGSSEANDCKNFGESFSGGAQRSNPTPNKKSNKNNKKDKDKAFDFSKFSINYKDPKFWIIIGAAALALILVVTVIIVIAVSSAGSDIKYQNNTYVAYKDNNDSYHVIANGKLVEQEFKGEIELIVAKDNSFAYVFDETDEGTVMYVLEGKKITPVNAGEAIAEVVTVSTLKPGIVYIKAYSSGDQYMLFNEKIGARRITSESKTPNDFCISADGETVTYTVLNKNEERVLCMYEDGTNTSTSIKNGTPVAISSYGDYIYYTSLDKNGDTQLNVYNISAEKPYTVEKSTNFLSILDMNINGDEIIFTVASSESIEDIIDEEEAPAEEPETEETEETEEEEVEEQVNGVTSLLYRYKEKKAENRIVTLGKGEITPMAVDPTIAVYSNFADTYVCSDSATYYIQNNYQKKSIHINYGGKISPDEKYFYFIDKDADLHKQTIGDNTDVVLASDVIDFEITEKGNLYILTIGGGDVKELIFYDGATKKTEITSFEVTALSFYDYADRIYFAEMDTATDGTVIKSAKDSVAGDKAKFGTTELKSLPYFVSSNQKVCYAIIYDSGSEIYRIYYTSNGSNFSEIRGVDNCEAVMDGDVELDLSDYMTE